MMIILMILIQNTSVIALELFSVKFSRFAQTNPLKNLIKRQKNTYVTKNNSIQLVYAFEDFFLV